MSESVSAGGKKPEVFNPVLLLVLGFVTCGIFIIYWMFKTAGELKDYLGKEVVSMTLLVLGICCFPLNIYNIYLLSKALPEVQVKAGIPEKDDTVLILILAIFAPPVAPMIVQTELNKAWEA